jgi:ABC-2 type transport system ATP-binding protein
MLTIDHVSKRYGRDNLALNDVSLSLPQGEIVGLLGENGAGKTTLMKCILGFLRYQGTITLDGEPITHKNVARLSFATGEHSFFPALTGEDHKEFYRAHFPAFRGDRYDALVDFFQLPRRRALGRLSTGQQNQFEVILALSQGADYILMDEPFAGNDLFNRADFYKVLAGILEPTETILLSTHLIEEVAPFLSRVVLLRQGQVAGDARTEDLEDKGKDVKSFVEDTYSYKADRVFRALGKLTGEREEGD